MNKDPRPYFDGRAVGCIAVASGWQASVTTLTALRSIVHALRGWPTPVGVALNSTVKLFDDDGNCLDENGKEQLELMGQQVFQFARMQMAMKS
jgi:FMN reductase